MLLPQPYKFHDRERELAQLERFWAIPGAQLVTLWGRRRVGKSALLSHFAAGKRAIYLYGARVAEPDILRDLALQAARALDISYLRFAPFPNWDVALSFLAEQSQDARILLIFDEFPYLCEATQGLDTLVQRWWDLQGQQADLMLVIAGSAFSAMAGLTGYDGALHGRRTGQMSVEPFDYFDASRFYPQLEPEDRVRAYATFGGIPAYLRYWQPDWTLSDAAQGTLLNPGHLLFRDGEELLRTEFHNEALYASILRTVAAGDGRPSDIARSVGRHGANEIAEHLRRLLDLRFLTREVPVTEWRQTRSRRVLYRIADPYLRFWFRFVAPFQSAIQLGDAEAIWSDEIRPRLDDFVARTTWEDVIIQYLWRRFATATLSVDVTHLGRWWDGQDEIDIVGLWDPDVVIVGECKWSVQPVDERVLAELRRKARKLDYAREPLWVLASRSGFTRELRRQAEGGGVLLIEPPDLFAGVVAGE